MTIVFDQTADGEVWRAKIVQPEKPKLHGIFYDGPRVELHKTVNNQVNLKVVVSLTGRYEDKRTTGWHHTTTGANVQLSMNGTAQLTFDELDELITAIREAEHVLRGMTP